MIRSIQQQRKDLLRVQRSMQDTVHLIDELVGETNNQTSGELIPSVKAELRVKRSRLCQHRLDISHLIASLSRD